MDPESLNGTIELLHREKITLPNADSDEFDGWNWLTSHGGAVWWDLFKFLNEKYNFYSRDGTMPVENKELELFKESEYEYGGGKDDITIVKKERKNPSDITAPKNPEVVSHIEVGELSSWDKLIGAVLSAPEFWWAGPIFNRSGPGPGNYFSNELWIIKLDGDPKELIDFYPDFDEVYPPEPPQAKPWEKSGLWYDG